MSDLKFAFRQLLNNVVDRYIGTWPFGIQGRVRAHEHDAPQAAINPVGADFFEIVNARVLRGGLFNDADTRGDANVAVINQTLAERFFPGEDPVGQIIERRGDGTSDARGQALALLPLGGHRRGDGGPVPVVEGSAHVGGHHADGRQAVAHPASPSMWRLVISQLLVPDSRGSPV
jgi:hypothetical protein